MILQKEIATIAEHAGVTKTVIDKDWVLGHFIAAIFSIPDIKRNLIFKGGTCLRKCWFPNYRFSEDLDFTSLSGNFEFTEKHLTEICGQVEGHTGIRAHIVSLQPILYRDKKVGYEAVVRYWGADHSRNESPPIPARWHTKIKIEIILYEQIIFAPVEKEISHPYSDRLLPIGKIRSYGIEEVLSEKIRALVQRSYTAPRDYYDIWYLYSHINDLNWGEIKDAFYEKMKFKEFDFTGVDQLINPKNRNTVKHAWKNSLGHQIPARDLPDFAQVEEELIVLFNKVFKEV